jgi:hypothetical protein
MQGKFDSVSDQDLLANTQFLASEERRIASSLIEHLREISRRKLFVDYGYASLFKYCIKSLKMSEAQSQRYIDVMRLVEELPEAKAKIESGTINLTVASQLQSFIRQEEKSRSIDLDTKSTSSLRPTLTDGVRQTSALGRWAKNSKSLSR